MPSKLTIALLIIFSITLFVIPVSGGAGQGSSRPPQKEEILTNQDIEKYKKPSDGETQSVINKKAESDNKTRKAEDRKEQEYWCKRAAYYKKKIEKAQDEVKKQDARLVELKEDASRELGKKRKALEKEIKKTRTKLKNAQKQLKDREKDIDRIENEAHKKGIPPGWLRCQFTW